MGDLRDASLLAGLDLGAARVRRRVRELLPPLAARELAAGEDPSGEQLAEAAERSGSQTLDELAEAVAVLLVMRRGSPSIEIDVNCVELAREHGYPLDGTLRPELSFDLHSLEWTVSISLGVSQGSEPAHDDGLVSIMVPADLELRDWLENPETQSWIADWYTQYHCEGILLSAARLGELHSMLAHQERFARVALATQLLDDPRQARELAPKIRAAGGPTAWAQELYDDPDPESFTILAGDGSENRERAVAELAESAAGLLKLADCDWQVEWARLTATARGWRMSETS